jgi:membrane-bound ClpP family serine protease
MMELITPCLLLIFGLFLISAEVLLPTSGALGVVGVGCLLLWLYLGFTTSAEMGFRYLFAEFVLVALTYGATSYLMSRTGMGRSASLRPPEPHEVGDSRGGPDLGLLVGQRGRTLTTLRPSGMVDFEGLRLDGVAEEGMIPPGASVLAVRVRSGRLIVRVEPVEEVPIAAE